MSFLFFNALVSELLYSVLSQMEDEMPQNTKECVAILSYVIQIFKKFFKIETALIGDSYATDQMIEAKLKTLCI